MNRRLEIMEVNSKTVKLTVAADRVTLKIPLDALPESAEKFKIIAEHALYAPELEFTVRGRIEELHSVHVYRGVSENQRSRLRISTSGLEYSK